MKSISIVIPTYNRWDTLQHVLPMLARQDFPADKFEILVCDSGSVDGTKEGVRDLAIPNVKFIEGENRGRSGARNRGIAAAEGEIVLFTDADILPDEHLLSVHSDAHDANPGCAAVGCEVQVDSLDEYDLVRRFPEKRRNMHRVSRSDLRWLFFLTGNASVPRSLLMEAGCFDEYFTGYGHEDLELGYRLQKKLGLRILYVPAAINYHWHPVGFEERCDKMRMAGVSTVRFYRKHHDPMINLQLGVNPFSMLWHSALPANGRVMKWLLGRREDSHFAREIVLQYHYLCGVKSAIRAKDLP